MQSGSLLRTRLQVQVLPRKLDGAIFQLDRKSDSQSGNEGSNPSGVTTLRDLL